LQEKLGRDEEVQERKAGFFGDFADKLRDAFDEDKFGLAKVFPGKKGGQRLG